MLMVISPAKKLDFENKAKIKDFSDSEFLDDSQQLADVMKKYSPKRLSNLMHLSDQLAQLNAARYGEWQRPFKASNSKQAVYGFRGDVYQGLDVDTLKKPAVNYLQKNLRILSGLYGYLKPLDLIQPYRLEMGTKLKNPKGSDLYAFWKETITEAVNQTLANQNKPVLINLASNEYFKAIDKKSVNATIITPAFKDWKNGQYKMISFFAKKARGLMVRYAAENKINNPEHLKNFDLDGYSFSPEMSTATGWTFIRKL
jgi:hypothetical protein